MLFLSFKFDLDLTNAYLWNWVIEGGFFWKIVFFFIKLMPCRQLFVMTMSLSGYFVTFAYFSLLVVRCVIVVYI